MGLIAVASAKGSPGVTTASLLLGALWPRPSVVAECDPSGGDVALRLPAPDGSPLDPQTGLLSLIAAGRRSMHHGLVAANSQQVVGGQDVLVGISGPDQATGISQWPALAGLLAGLPGADVVADLGRVGAQTPQNALLERAAVIVLVVDTLPSNVVHLRDRARRINEEAGVLGPRLHVLVVAPPKRGRAVREVADTLEQARVQVVGVHHLAEDPTGAAYFLGQVRGTPARTHLVRSATPIVAELARQTFDYFHPAQAEGSGPGEVAATPVSPPRPRPPARGTGPLRPAWTRAWMPPPRADR